MEQGRRDGESWSRGMRNAALRELLFGEDVQRPSYRVRQTTAAILNWRLIRDEHIRRFFFFSERGNNRASYDEAMRRFSCLRATMNIGL